MITYPRSLMPGYVDRVAEVLDAAPRAIRVVEEVVIRRPRWDSSLPALAPASCPSRRDTSCRRRSWPFPVGLAHHSAHGSARCPPRAHRSPRCSSSVCTMRPRPRTAIDSATRTRRSCRLGYLSPRFRDSLGGGACSSNGCYANLRRLHVGRSLARTPRLVHRCRYRRIGRGCRGESPLESALALTQPEPQRDDEDQRNVAGRCERACEQCAQVALAQLQRSTQLGFCHRTKDQPDHERRDRIAVPSEEVSDDANDRRITMSMMEKLTA